MLPHPQKLFGAESAKAYAGAGCLRQYFTGKPKPPPLIMGCGHGCPSKRRKTHLALGDNGPAHNAPVYTLEGEEHRIPHLRQMDYSKKNMRINWGKGEHHDLLEKAIYGWRKMAGNINNGEACCKCYKFAKNYGIIPPNFLQVCQT
jgi:hypothetical protein